MKEVKERYSCAKVVAQLEEIYTAAEERHRS